MKDFIDIPASPRPRSRRKFREANPRAVLVRLMARSMSKAQGTRRHDFRIGRLPKYVAVDRIKLNRELMTLRPLFKIQKENIQLREKTKPQRKMKSNAAVIIAGIITFGREAAIMFASLDIEAQNEAIKELAREIAAKLDTQVESLVIHLDETALHAHFTLRAYTFDGLAVSNTMKVDVMSALQDLAAEVMQRYHPGIERGYRKPDRLAAGADYADTIHRSVREMHHDLPIELEMLREQRAEEQSAVAALSAERVAQQHALDAILAERDDVEGDLNVLWEEQQSQVAELAMLKAEQKAHQSELDALQACAAKTRRHLSELDAKAVEEAKKDKRRQNEVSVAMRLKADQVVAREVAVSRKESNVAAAQSELDASLAAIDHVVAAVDTGAIRVGDNGKIIMDDPAPVSAAPKPLRDRLMPTIIRLVRKIDKTETRASLVETMISRVRKLLSRADLPEDIEKEARDIQADWTP